MNQQQKIFIRDFLRAILGRYIYTWIRFVSTHRYIPHFRKPRSMNEKIIHRKLYDNPQKYSKYTSKYTVREYVKDTIGEEYLIPLYKAKSFIVPEDFDDLPDSFVIKTSNGGGGVNVQIVRNKAELNLQEICDQFNSYMEVKVGVGIDELFYDLEEPLILFEKLMLESGGLIPSDYKFNVIRTSNEPYVFVQVDEDRFTNHKRSFFDEQGEKLPWCWNSGYQPVSSSFTLPANYREMCCIAKKLAEQFSYVRVDLYSDGLKIYFGELTFCQGSGFEAFTDREVDFELGRLWTEF